MNLTSFLALNWWRFLLAAAFDFLDFTIGRIPLIGIVMDAAGTVLSLWLWGWPGALQAFELVDMTEQFDAWIPTVTIAGLARLVIDTKKRG